MSNSSFCKTVSAFFNNGNKNIYYLPEKTTILCSVSYTDRFKIL